MSNSQIQQELSACLNRLKNASIKSVLADKEFRSFHQDRNNFNDNQVTKLIEQPPYSMTSPVYKDNLGRIWHEETIGVKYHTDKWSVNPFKILTDDEQTLRKWGKQKKNRFSRKFLMNDPLPGYIGSSSEMIVNRSGARIISGEYMETFNFGKATLRSSISGQVAGLQVLDPGLHYKFDMITHEKFGHSDYKCYDAKPVRIVDMVDLFESGQLDLKKLFSSRSR